MITDLCGLISLTGTLWSFGDSCYNGISRSQEGFSNISVNFSLAWYCAAWFPFKNVALPLPNPFFLETSKLRLCISIRILLLVSLA